MRNLRPGRGTTANRFHIIVPVHEETSAGLFSQMLPYQEMTVSPASIMADLIFQPGQYRYMWRLQFEEAPSSYAHNTVLAYN
jgi:hypothetical protein